MSPPTIKTLAAMVSIATLFTFAAVPAHAQGSTAAQTASLTVTFMGLKSTQGALMIALFDTEAAYSGGQPVQAVKLAANAASLSVPFIALKPGRYAIKAFHDLNEDGKLNTNPFGGPSEPYAFSNGAKANMRPPAWSEAAFTVNLGHSVQTLVIE